MRTILKAFLKSFVFFVMGGLVYIYFDLFAPYCAKHECCASSGMPWVLLPNLSAIFMCIGFIVLLLNIIEYEPEEKDED